MESEQSTTKDNFTNAMSNTMSNLTTTAMALVDERQVTGIAQAVIGVIGIFGNMCVVITFSTNKKLRNKIIIKFIINQASINI